MSAPAAAASAPGPAARSAFAALPVVAKFNLIALGLAAIALVLRLWPEWRRNPDLSHGFFLPLIFLWLVHEARTQAAPRWLDLRGGWRAVQLLLIAGGVLALGAGGLYAAAVDWSHALVIFTLAIAFVFFLTAGLLTFAGRDTRCIGFNWPAVVAVVLWLLSVPLPPGSYSRLTLSLQLWVSEGVLRVLHILGIAAIRHGNIIEMANSTVGVEEACSGIRSLISCVFTGFIFSALLVRGTKARVAIVVLSVPLALGMNFLRSLTLTLLANRGVDIAGTWHDVTGFAVLGLTAALLAGLAVVLDRGSPVRPADKLTARDPLETATPPAADSARASRPPQLALAAGLGLASVLVAIFVLNTRPAMRRDSPVPDLFALLPATADGWQVKTSDLYEFAGTLQTDHLAQRRYVKTDAKGAFDITLYVAYWRPGQAPVSLVAVHTPDACLPGNGWTPQRTANARMPLVTRGRVVADSEYRLFTTGDYPQHVWFWHLYDGRPIDYRDPYSPKALLQIAWRYGFRHDGDQLFVRVSSNRPWSEIASEPLLAEFFARTRGLGL